MDFVAQPPQEAPVSTEAMTITRDSNDSSVHGNMDGHSWDGSQLSGTDDSDDEIVPDARYGESQRPFIDTANAAGPSAAGEAVAVAALTADYGAWLKRLAVRLRRAIPAGERFVRLRRIAPAVTGEEVSAALGQRVLLLW